MVNGFLSEDFLLQSDFACRLYHDHAAPQPIIDYHNHLPPSEIADNRIFENITAVWLAGDHYKWRAMRTLGIPEEFITGEAPDPEKFEKWAFTVPYTMRNPLYHWTHLELKRYFGFNDLLTPANAASVYNDCSAMVNTPEFATRALLEKMNVQVVCTTDDPADTLEYHRRIQSDSCRVRVLPAFRPDKAYDVTHPDYLNYVELLGTAANISIRRFGDLVAALKERIHFFHSSGCRLADHGLEQLYYFSAPPADPEVVFKKLNKGGKLTQEDAASFRCAILLELCRAYHQHGWVQQFHLGALRNTNERMLKTLGPNTGFDSIGDFRQASSLAQFLNALDRTNQLAKTVLYNVNPRDNEVLATMIGNFNDGSVKGKMQFGSAWWFLDQKEGMEAQLNTLSNLGLLSCFIGMLTDSRSFLSFPRHEYFRRILCNLIGKDVEQGELPRDEEWLGQMVKDICYFNARNYFGY